MNRCLRRNDFANPNSQRHYGNAAGALLLGGVAVVTTAIGCGVIRTRPSAEASLCGWRSPNWNWGNIKRDYYPRPAPYILE